MTTSHDHICDCAREPHASGGRALAAAEVVSLLLLATFLIFSVLSGRLRFFLAPVFIWLPPAAAVLLLAMSAARLFAFRARGATCECDDNHSGSTAMRWFYTIVIIVPLVFALAVNPRQFSSEGVRKRTAPAAARDAALERAMNWVLDLKPAPNKAGTPSSDELPSEPTVAELMRALESDGGRALAGKFVTVIGQCGADNATAGGRFELYRLVVTCCIADATAVSVEVAGLPTVTVEPGQWLRIGGVIAIESGASPQAVLRAASISKIPVPSNPYL
ncbi:MAG: TIGR03943 family protein [Verrucomicrobia bacterium]|nr:TIGR03943 family protein [Verrucomicrobiota bacterium]